MNEELGDLLTRMLAPSYVWGPALTTIQFKAMMELLCRRRVGLHDKTCIDFGCGAIRPLSTSTMMYLLGASNVLGVDLAAPADEARIAVGIYVLILAMLSGRVAIDPTSMGVTPRELRRRCAEFDLAALLKGDLRGIPAPIRLQTRDYLTLPPEERRFDFLTSYSVLEHVGDIMSYLKAFRASVSETGMVFAAVDYRDHRVYTVKASRWQYLLDDSDHAPGYINKVRHSEMLRLITEAGFSIMESRIVEQEPSQQELAGFLPRYREMSREDIVTTEAHFLLTPV